MKSTINSSKIILYSLVLSFITILFPTTSNASHLGGGEIHYKCIGFSKYEVSVILYSDCSGVPPSNYVFLNYQSSCGMGTAFINLSSVSNVNTLCPSMAGSTTCLGGSFPGIERGIYTDTITLPGNCPDWTFSMRQCCRTSTMMNIANPTNTEMTITATLDNSSYYCNSNVRFENPAAVLAQPLQPFVYDPRGVDDDGDDLVYSLVSALDILGVPVFYNFGTTPQLPLLTTATGFNFDSQTGRFWGTLANAALGDYIVTYQVDEYRNGDLIASTMREVKVTVGNFLGATTNTPPTHSLSNISGGFQTGDTISLCSGTSLSFDILATDSDVTDTINIIHYDVYNNTVGATFTQTGSNSVVGTFSWAAATSGVHKVGFIIQDPKCPIVGSHQYRVVTIIVQSSGPALSITDQFLCSSPTISIIANGTFSSYIWSTGDTTQTIAVDTAGIYSITTTGACGLASSAVEIFDAPEVIVNGGNSDTIIVYGDSIQLLATLANGLASDLYFSKDTSHIVPKGDVTTVSLSVDNIFPTILDSGSVVDVCLDITQVAAGDLDIYLVAPNGAMIELSTNNGSSGTYSNTCFSINASDLITNYSGTNIPSDSSFVPAGNWEHFYGANAATEWQLAIRHDSSNTLDGMLNHFSIQFGGGYDYVWTPNQNISCTDCPNPIVWPDTTTSYIVEMNDGVNCVTFDTITVIVPHSEPIDTVYADVAEDSTILICSNFPASMGAFTSVNILTNPVFGTIAPSFTFTSSSFCFEYTATSAPQVTDTFTVAFCDNFICDTTVFIITTTSCVWAGDTDTDQLVNNFDLLNIGLGHGETGIVRPNADLLFDCEPNRNWTNNTPVTNINYKHSDCDGNGIVDGNDTLAIINNWGQFYLKNNSSPPLNPIPFYTEYQQTVPGATIQVPIMLGDTTNPVDSAYGVAFTINYDQTLVDSASVSVSFNNSWMGTINSDMISISKDFYTQGQIHVGLTRIDQTPINGLGQIGLIQMTIKDDIIKKSNNVHLNMHIDNVRFITDQENEIPTVPVYTYVLILDTTTITNNPIIEDAANLTIYPNPASSIVHLQSDNSIINQFNVFNASGQEVYSKLANDNRTQFPVSDLPSGIYVIRVQTNKGLYNKRFVIRR
jgi:subtilisin-like proprotein convertase family protein